MYYTLILSTSLFFPPFKSSTYEFRVEGGEGGFLEQNQTDKIVEVNERSKMVNVSFL